MGFLHELSQHSEKNLMTTQNIGIVFGPTLMRAREQADFLSGVQSKSVDVVVFMLEHFKELFAKNM